MKTRRSDSRLHRGRTLDVLPRADPRNGRHPMAVKLAALADLPLTSKIWACPTVLDQGSEGACVGFAAAHFYAAEARPQPVNARTARSFYKGAQKYDEWPGEHYEGSSVNGLMAYLKSAGLIGEYDWLFTWPELERTLSLVGPVIVGSEWREECFYPDPSGLIEFDGPVRGGHATCWRGIDYERERIVIQQSWGRSHGDGGTVYMSFDDAQKLLRTAPQICHPEKRALQSQIPPRKWWQFWI